MKNNISFKKIFFLAAVCCLSIKCIGINFNYPTNPPNFCELSYEKANQVLDNEIRTILFKKGVVRPEYTTNLISQLRSGRISDDNKTLAIYLLGFVPPSHDAIEYLIENIDFKAPRLDPTFAPRRWGEYPAMEALGRMGQPVIDPILAHLPKETSELRRQLLCDALKQALRNKPVDVISAVRLNNIDAFDRMAGGFRSQQEGLIAQLVDIFNDAQSPLLTRGAAAYCLGELHASKAADALASGITLEISSVSSNHLTMLQGPIVMKALVKIGNPAIPAVLRNLAESDDAKVRELSLEVIERIDGDKDISTLRLQKAIKAETDAQKQTRLQAALKALIGS